MQEHWRWLLVDQLAHGKKWYNTHHAALVDDPQYQILQEDYDRESDLREKMKMAQFLSEKLQNNIDQMYCGFSKPEAARILQTPRFDINDSFMKADIPDDQREYFDSLPSLAIPFREFWVEWKWSDIDKDREARFACRVIATDPLEDHSFRLRMTAFISLPKDGREDCCLNHEATAYITGERKIEKLVSDSGRTNDEIMLYPCIHALALLGCKNVSATEVNAPRGLRREVLRTFGVALCSYRVVTINHARRKVLASDGTGHHGRAMSICRGHFKTFAGEKGLFGHKSGTWWWQDHVRGDYERGVVVKDYVLKGKSA